MTKLRKDDRHIAVTLLEIVPQEVIRYKTSEKDGYSAAILGAGKKDLKKEKGQKVSYALLKEFAFDDAFASAFPAGSVVSQSLLEGVESVVLTGTSKGKGFA
jgi:ribosomal protein L3